MHYLTPITKRFGLGSREHMIPVSKGNCCSIDIGTRWSATDVLGRMEEMGKYDEIIRISALDENDESFCEDVHTTEYYHELREEETEDMIWCAEYMQDPIEAIGFCP